MRFILGQNLFIRRINHSTSELTQEETTAWDQLLRQDDVRRAFMSRHYIDAAAITGMDVIVLILYDENAPCGFLPLQRMAGLRGRVGIFEPVGGIMTDYFGLVAAPGMRIDIQQLLVATHGKVNAVLFTHLDETQAIHGLTGEESRVGLRALLVSSPAQAVDEYWTRLRQSDKKLVYDTERGEKKLINEVGPVTFEWISQKPAEDMVWLIAYKKAQYQRTGKAQAPLFDARNVALLNGLLSSHEESCQGILSVLRCGGNTIAVHFGLRCYDMLHYWFPVYDPQFATYSPGRILLKHLFSAAAGQGVHLFDHGEGDTQSKRKFSNEEHFFYRGLWSANDWRGLRARLILSAFWRMKRWLG